MAAGRGRLRPGCIAHSDRGSEHTSKELRRELCRLGLRQSMGHTGSCFDNTAESFFAVLKEEIGTRRWPDRATDRVEIFAFNETFYNRRRLRKPPSLGLPHPAGNQAATRARTRPRTVASALPRTLRESLHGTAGRNRSHAKIGALGAPAAPLAVRRHLPVSKRLALTTHRRMSYRARRPRPIRRKARKQTRWPESRRGTGRSACAGLLDGVSAFAAHTLAGACSCKGYDNSRTSVISTTRAPRTTAAIRRRRCGEDRTTTLGELVVGTT